MTASLRGIGIVAPELIATTAPVYSAPPGSLPTGISAPANDYYGSSWCGSGNWFVDFFCTEDQKKALMEQIITSDSDYGSQLTEENRLRAEQMARDLVAGDDPCNYSEIPGQMGWAGKFDCYIQGKAAFPLPDLMIPILIVGAIILFATLKK